MTPPDASTSLVARVRERKLVQWAVAYLALDGMEVWRNDPRILDVMRGLGFTG